jgi:Wax ester synthase/diacylglycerol acyltransferase catalytic domain/Phage integrase, N-terminal SAM-like domain
VAAFGALFDLAVGAAGPAAAPWTPAPIPSAGELLPDNLRRRAHGLGRALSNLAEPAATLQRAQATWPAWQQTFAERRAPRTSLNRPIGPDRKLAIIGGRLDLVKKTAHRHGATLNDVTLAAIAGGLRQLLLSREEPVGDLTLRAMVPVSLHGKQPGPATEYAAAWLDERPGLRPKTLQLYRYLLHAHLQDEFGSRTIGSISEADVRRWRADLLSRGVSPVAQRPRVPLSLSTTAVLKENAHRPPGARAQTPASGRTSCTANKWSDRRGPHHWPDVRLY